MQPAFICVTLWPLISFTTRYIRPVSQHFKTIYQDHAHKYDQLVSCEDYQGNLLSALAGIVDLEGLRVVELGAGTGRITRLLAPRVQQIFALDEARAMLQIAERHSRELGYTNISYTRARHQSLPLRAGLFDMLIEGWAFGHLLSWYPGDWEQQLESALGEAARVVRKHGTIILVETLGTGRTEPEPPNSELAALYQHLEQRHEYNRIWVRTDYQFESLSLAVDLVSFFFGQDLAKQVEAAGKTILPECTGIWYKTNR